MKNDLLMDFIVDKVNNKVIVKRKFLAPMEIVWSAWTESETLDKWWAPKPWKAKTKKMDFREGGYWLYAMVGPEGEEHWARADFKSITHQKNFKYIDAFCDSDGNINKDLPSSNWNVDFSELGNSTIVLIEIKHEKPSDLEKIIEMGFKEGFTMALENLDEILNKN